MAAWWLSLFKVEFPSLSSLAGLKLLLLAIIPSKKQVSFAASVSTRSDCSTSHQAKAATDSTSRLGQPGVRCVSMPLS